MRCRARYGDRKAGPRLRSRWSAVPDRSLRHPHQRVRQCAGPIRRVGPPDVGSSDSNHRSSADVKDGGCRWQPEGHPQLGSSQRVLQRVRSRSCAEGDPRRLAGRAGKHSRRERRERPQESHRQEGLAGQEAGCEQADVCGQKISQRRITPLRHDAGDRRADPARDRCQARRSL
jgi:hypothetical protein